MKIGFNKFQSQTDHRGRGIGFYAEILLRYLKKIPNLEILEFSDQNSLETVDLVHYPSFDFFWKTLPIRKKYPTVVTIHDITPLLFPKHYPPGIKGFLNLQFQKQSLKSVKKIITDSENSKKDIMDYFNFPNSNIIVVPLAPSTEFKLIKNSAVLEKVKLKYNLPEVFALFGGNINWNKNILNQVEACIESKVHLILIGKSFEARDDINHPELKSFREFLETYADNEYIHILGFVPTEDLVALYNLAKMTLFVSFYEGFGLPILEAQACGCPVITSNVSSMPEVAGEAALLVDPSSEKEISQAVEKILSDQTLKNKLIQKGFENVKRFSWQKTANETVKIYGKVLNIS